MDTWSKIVYPYIRSDYSAWHMHFPILWKCTYFCKLFKTCIFLHICIRESHFHFTIFLYYALWNFKINFHILSTISLNTKYASRHLLPIFYQVVTFIRLLIYNKFVWNIGAVYLKGDTGIWEGIHYWHLDKIKTLKCKKNVTIYRWWSFFKLKIDHR